MLTREVDGDGTAVAQRKDHDGRVIGVNSDAIHTGAYRQEGRQLKRGP